MVDRPDRTDGTRRLASYIHEVSLGAVPDEVRRETGRRIIDTLAAVTAGHQFPAIQEASGYVRTVFSDGSKTILDGSGESSNGPGATFINTLAANELDVDDGNRLAEGHPAAVILPATIAALEAVDGTIEDLLVSFLTGYEVGVRTSMAMHDWIGMHTGSGSWGAVGAAAAVSRVRGFDVETTTDALGIAEFTAPITPVMRSVANPAGSMTKDGIGWGGFVGYTAADMADRGFGGSGTLFDEIEYEGLDPAYLDSLGDRYHIRKGYYKPHPACRWAHAGIDAVGELMAENDIQVTDIEAVDVYTHPKGAELGITRPKTPSEAEYSYPYIIARAIANQGRITPADLQPTALEDPDSLSLADKVNLHVDDEAAHRYPEESLGRVTIVTGDEVFRSGLVSPRGSAERPVSQSYQEEKWETLIDEYLGRGTTDLLLDRITETSKPIGHLIEPWK